MHKNQFNQMWHVIAYTSLLLLALIILVVDTKSVCEKGATTEDSCIPPEVAAAANNPKTVVEFADDGGPFSKELVAQDPTSGNKDGDEGGICLSGVYFETPKRYILKKAQFSTKDRRIFDFDTGVVVLASYHWGKNPYQSLDPWDLLDVSDHMGGEWKSVTNVASYHDNFPSFKIRPKTLSMHKTQYVDVDDDDKGIIMNVGKMSRIKTLSMSPVFFVSRDKDSEDIAYKVVGDLIGRRLSVQNTKGEVVAQITKTNKALLQVAMFGSGSESIIDIAPGVDCSTILSIVFAINQVGVHYLKDALSNFVKNPMKDHIVDSAVDAAEDIATGADMGDVAAEFVEDITFGIDSAEGLVDAAEGLADVADMAADNLGDVADFFLSLFG